MIDHAPSGNSDQQAVSSPHFNPDAGEGGLKYILMRLCQMLAGLLLLAALPASNSIASGHLGPTPIGPYKFRNFAACRTYLEEQHASDVATIRSMPLRSGSVESEQSVETKGVVQSGKREARYDVVRGYVSRVIMEDSKSIRSQYSYTERHFVCKGKTLTGTALQGYHLPTFEPVGQSAKEAVMTMPEPTSAVDNNLKLSAEEN